MDPIPVNEEDLNDTYSVHMDTEESGISVGTVTTTDESEISSALVETFSQTLNFNSTDACSTPSFTDATSTTSTSTAPATIDLLLVSEPSQLESEGFVTSCGDSSLDQSNTILSIIGSRPDSRSDPQQLQQQHATLTKDEYLEGQSTTNMDPGPSRLNKAFVKTKIPIRPGSNIWDKHQVRLHHGCHSFPSHTSTPMPDLVDVPNLGHKFNFEEASNKA